MFSWSRATGMRQESSRSSSGASRRPPHRFIATAAANGGVAHTRKRCPRRMLPRRRFCGIAQPPPQQRGEDAQLCQAAGAPGLRSTFTCMHTQAVILRSG